MVPAKRKSLELAAGKSPNAKKEAQKVITILQRDDFWDDLKRVKDHLEPFAVAANVTQADNARLDVVLLTLANLFRLFSSDTYDFNVRIAVLSSLEKRWAAADQPVFVLAVVLNPYVRTVCFATTSPFRTVPALWPLLATSYRRVMQQEPPLGLRDTFSAYVRRSGKWADAQMALDDFKQTADAQGADVNLIQVWSEYDDADVDPAAWALAQFAKRILSVVPNSAATERLFSKFGIVHSKLRNRLQPERVRKTVLVRTHLMTKFGPPPRPSRKRAFGDDAESTEDGNGGASTANEADTSNNDSLSPSAGVESPVSPSDPATACSATAGPAEYEVVGAEHGTATAASTRNDDEDSDDEVDPASIPFHSIAEELIAGSLADDLGPSPTPTPTHTEHSTRPAATGSAPAASAVQPENFLLGNLFRYPPVTELASPSMKALYEFWAKGERGLGLEVRYHELVHENTV